jgi:plastocyanin
MKRIFTFILPLFVVLSTSVQAETHVITQTGVSFEPSALTVTIGDVVRWEWTSSVHNTISTSVPVGAATWNAALDSEHPSFEYTVTVPGNYDFHCSFHAANMNGSFTATTVASVKPLLTSNRDLTVGQEMGTRTIHIRVAGGLPMEAAIRVYDITGKVLVTLHEGTISSEEKKVEYDAAELSRGIYFVRFETSGNVITRKVLLE